MEMNKGPEEHFRFRVLSVGYFNIANEWYVDGILEYGEIRPPVKATAKVGGDYISLFIKTIALVSARKESIQENRFTLSIEKPPILIDNLIGIHITGMM